MQLHLQILGLYSLVVFTALVESLVIPFRRINLPSERPALAIEPRQEAVSGSPATTLGTVTFEPSGFVVTIKPTTSSPATSTSSTSISSTVSTSIAQSISTSASTSSTSTTSASTTTSSTTATATGSTTQQPQQTTSGASQKLVVAHHMVGNTFPYTKQDWLDDIVLAQQSGIDGFALNTGQDDWEPARITDAYQAALESNLDFKLFISLDMTSLPCNSAADAQALRTLVLAHADHPNQLKYDGRAFVSTFSGETCQFGQGDVADAWKSQFTQNSETGGKVYFVPSFFIDPSKFGDFNGVMDGDFNWNSGWPIQVTTSFAQDLLNKLASSVPTNQSGGILTKPLGQVLSSASSAASSSSSSSSPSAGNQLQAALGQFIGSTETDTQHLDALKALTVSLGRRDGGDAVKPVYMAAVSPWFFTHYGADSFNKNFIFLSDQHLYPKRWESIFETRDQLDIVQVLTWNDYGESHYVGPIKGDQPNSQSWTNGMNHTAWLGLTKYYATAFKTGAFPAIEKDQIYMWSRPHSAVAQTSDPVPQPTNFELTEDTVWAVVMTTAPSTVTLSTSATSQTSFNVPAGLSKLSVPITPGGTLKGVIERDGNALVTLSPTPEEFTFQGSPQTYNFNAFVASATAD